MTRILLICLCIALITSNSRGHPTCGVNQQLVSCPTDCAADYCPTHEGQDARGCRSSDTCAADRCKCFVNYRIAHNGTCIPTTSCPPFKCSQRYEVYDACPQYCPSDSCADVPLNGVCPFNILILRICNPACKCAQGYARHNGVCVPYHKCPKNKN